MAESGSDDRRRAERIEMLVGQIATIPDATVRAHVEELVQALLDLYGDGLARMLALTEQAPSASTALIEAFAADELVGSLLLLHGLHPLDVETRVAQAVDGVQPYAESQGQHVELLGIVDGVAHLRMQGTGRSCSVSADGLRQAIEDALYAAAPELDEVRVEMAPPQRLITLTRASRRTGAGAPHPVG